MRLYSWEGELKTASPSVVFHGLSGDEHVGFRRLEDIVREGGIPSQARKIQEGTFKWDKTRKVFEEEWMLELYARMLSKGQLDPDDILKKIDGLPLPTAHELNYPTPFVSTTTSLPRAVEYAGMVQRPVLVFKTGGLQGVDLRGKWANSCSEVLIFDSLPLDNLCAVVDFSGKPQRAREMLRDSGYHEVQVVRGYTNGFRYRALFGGWGYSIPWELKDRPEALTFYQTKQIQMEKKFSTPPAP